MLMRRTLALGWLVSSLLTLGACSSTPPPSAPTEREARGEQLIVDRAADAVQRMRRDPAFANFDHYLAQARAVLIFPRLIRASLIFGGEGGSGVLLVKGDDGSWSPPAFYSLGASSVGLQVGYRESTVVLFLMNEATLERVLSTNLKLGTQAGTAVGEVGHDSQVEGRMMTRDIYQLVEAGGAYVGVSLDGYVISPRHKYNQQYYGRNVPSYEIVRERKWDRPGTAGLRQALDRDVAPSR